MPAAALNACLECVSVSCLVLRVSLSCFFGLQLISGAGQHATPRSRLLWLPPSSSWFAPAWLSSSVISIKRAKLSYDDKCRSSNGNQLVNALRESVRERQVERVRPRELPLPAAGYSKQPHSEITQLRY